MRDPNYKGRGCLSIQCSSHLKLREKKKLERGYDESSLVRK